MHSRAQTMIIVQEIITIWTKASRGGVGAARRNRVPRILPLPPVPPDAAVVHHVVTFSERDGFEPSPARCEALPVLPERFRCVRLAWDGAALSAAYQWLPECGAPGRDLQPPRRLF